MSQISHFFRASPDKEAFTIAIRAMVGVCIAMLISMALHFPQPFWAIALRPS